MPTKAAGAGPIVFFTSTGTQVSIPLSAIYFDAAGEVKVDRTADADTEQLEHWLKHLVGQRRITPASAPPPAPRAAMVVTAVVPGSDGNRIEVGVTPNADDQSKVDVTVTEIDDYAGLSVDSASPSFVATVLGRRTGGAGTKASLVRVDTIDSTPPLPDQKPAVANTPAAAGIPTWKIVAHPDASGLTPTSFTLAARDTGSDGAGAAWTIEVTSVDTTAATFALRVTWTRTVTAVGNATDLADLAQKLGFVVSIRPPEGATAYDKLPLPGTFTLRGGAERVDARPATATVPAKA